MLAAGAERDTLALGVGGGIASDVFGFAAATYMRGVAYAHVATSLVAMVDAAIGGKTGVNVAAGKNLAGVLRSGRRVLRRDRAANVPAALRDGLAEVVKAAVIEGGDSSTRSRRSLRIRCALAVDGHRLVRRQSQDRPSLPTTARKRARELLNLGHTFAHAIEARPRIACATAPRWRWDCAQRGCLLCEWDGLASASIFACWRC